MLTKFINYFITSHCSVAVNKLPRNGSRRAGHLHTGRDGRTERQTDTALCKVGISFNAVMRDAILTNFCGIAAHDAELSQTISPSWKGNTLCSKRKDNKRGLLVCFCVRCQSLIASFSFIVCLLHSCLFLCFFVYPSADISCCKKLLSLSLSFLNQNRLGGIRTKSSPSSFVFPRNATYQHRTFILPSATQTV
jgi:hypothetical protein